MVQPAPVLVIEPDAPLGGIIKAATGWSPDTKHPDKPVHNTLWDRLKRSLNELKGKKTKKLGQRDLSKLLSSLRNLGLNHWNTDLTKWHSKLGLAQTYEEKAVSLIDGDKITKYLTDMRSKNPNEFKALWPDTTQPIPPDSVHAVLKHLGMTEQGHDALEWLSGREKGGFTGVLGYETALRRTLIGLAIAIKAKFDERHRFLQQVLTRLYGKGGTAARPKKGSLVWQSKDYAAKIKHYYDLLHPKGKHAKAPTGKVKKDLEGKLKHFQGLKKPVDADIKTLTTQVLPVTRNQLKTLNTDWADDTGADLAKTNLRDSYTLYGPMTSGGAGLENVMGQLYELQGPVGKNTILYKNVTANELIHNLPGSFANWFGQIGDTLGTIKDFGSQYFTPPEEPTSPFTDLQNQLLKEINENLAKALIISEESQSVISRSGDLFPPYGGSFATGGVVPGYPGEPRTIIAHGQEEIVPVGGRQPVEVHIHGKGTTLEDLIDVRVKQGTRTISRGANSRLPSAGGGMRF